MPINTIVSGTGETTLGYGDVVPISGPALVAYLKATGYQLGLIINFHVEVLHDGVVRIIQSESS